jgi:hypothetical protein
LCLIIDANKTADFVNEPQHEDHRPIYCWVFRGGVVALGGKLWQEQAKLKGARRLFAEWLRAGRARRYQDHEIAKEEAKVIDEANCESNDQHIIALARVSGARVLFSDDRALAADFTNRAVLSSPAGKVYKRKQHCRLLSDAPPCRKAHQTHRSPDRVS